MTGIIDAVVAAVQKVKGGGEHHLHPARLTKEDIGFVGDCVHWEPTGYGFIEKFEAELRDICGVDHAIAVSSGTAALHLALLGVGVRAGDEVLVPAMTFVATANAVAHCGAVPHFVDSNFFTLGVHPRKLNIHIRESFSPDGDALVNRRSGRRLAAIIMVDMLGHPCLATDIEGIAAHFGIPVIEDAAEAFGSRLAGRACGSFGRAGVLSFNNNKIVTTGGGGAVLTDDPALAQAARALATTAKAAHPWKWCHTQTAYNYRMPNLCAALGLGQARRLPEILTAKRELADAYAAAFAGMVPTAKFMTAPPDAASNYWINALLMPPGQRAEPVLEGLHRAGLYGRAAFTPMHKLPMYADCPRDDLSVAEDIAERLVCLPSGI